MWLAKAGLLQISPGSGRRTRAAAERDGRRWAKGMTRQGKPAEYGIVEVK